MLVVSPLCSEPRQLVQPQKAKSVLPPELPEKNGKNDSDAGRGTGSARSNRGEGRMTTQVCS